MWGIKGGKESRVRRGEMERIGQGAILNMPRGVARRKVNAINGRTNEHEPRIIGPQ